MITYNYRCPECGEFTEQHRMGLAPEFAECPNCHTRSRRLLMMPNVHWHCRGSSKGRVDPFRHADGSRLEKSVLEGDRAKELDVER